MTTTTQATSTHVPKPSRQPSKHLKKQVQQAFDADVLVDICTTWDFDRYAKRVDLSPRGAHERFYYYRDNGSDILAVAHLDSVQDDTSCKVIDTAAGPLAVSGALDDRLGAYVILEMLPKLGITCDWLLTTDEEIGDSTACEFFTDKTYNWMFQFDRGGTDVVMYNYETLELCALVEDAGARVGDGSFSDICMLDHLGCAGFNWGVGYQDYHSERSHAWLNDTFRMVARFAKFHKADAKTMFDYDDRWHPSAWSEETTVADCGHGVNLDDVTTFVDSIDYVCCTACATPIDYLTRVGLFDEQEQSA